MRLIDAEKSIDCTDCVVGDCCRAGIFKNCNCIVENIFDSQPIAYDVDKVCEELESAVHPYCLFDVEGCDIDEVCLKADMVESIVRRGGVSD